MMAKMRGLAPAFIITVGVLFVLFMVISDSNVMEALGGRTNNVGSINGVDITYQEFQAALDQQREVRRQSGQEVDDEQIDQFRNQVWDFVVSQILIEQQVKRLGITVSDEEIKDIILGDNPPTFLKQNFIDSVGNFNRELYENALFDPQNEQALINAEESVRQFRLNEKLQSIILASVNVTEDEVLRKFIDQNIYVNDAEYASISLSIFPDSIIQVTDEDLRKYYEDNINKYKESPKRKLKFVLFGNQPSKKDSQLVIKDLDYVKSNFEGEDTTNFKYYVEIYSSQSYSKDTLAMSSFNTEAIELFKSAEPGDIVGPVTAPEGVVLYHFLGTITTNDAMARASHILINKEGDDEKNLVEANTVYNQLIAGAEFEELATEKSGDPGSASRGGDLGWFGKGKMIKEFEEAVFNGKIGEIQKPVKTSFGYHIIKVTDRSNKKYIVEKIVNAVKQSATTRDERYNAANDLSYLANKNGFEKELGLMNYNNQESGYFTEDSKSIPGIGVNERLVKWSFENGLNSVSDVYKVAQGFLVATISEMIEGGIIPFDEVKDQQKPNAVRINKLVRARLLAEELRSKLNNDLKKITELDPRFTVKNTGRFNSETNIPGIGKNYTFIQASIYAEPNVILEPVEASTGYFLVKVISKSSFDSTAYSMQSSTIRNNIIQQKKRTLVSLWLNALKEKSDIVNNMHLFYGY
ncbi:MAG: peptidylprolyl isomerase [Bacteroidetes bacterium]|nr:peptidylprolyl isomerase [Bacteroidota bacterium]